VRVVVVLFFLILITVVGTMLINQNRTYQRIAEKAAILAEQERAAAADNEEIKVQKEKVGSDEYYEKVARDQLGLVRSGETIYQTES
jgi:cell division protein DivIC